MFLTYRYRLKDRRAADRRALRAQARAVNWVWNYCCQTQRAAERKWRAGGNCPWPSAFDLTTLTAGCAAELGVHSDTITAICHRFARARAQHGRCPAWRAARKSLDWVPIQHASEGAHVLRLQGGAVRFRKREYRLWWSRDLPADAHRCTASFNCDARGRWHFNLTIETAVVQPQGTAEVGIDLGLKSLAAISDGTLIPNLRHLARYAEALAKAQRANSRGRVRAIHARIANARKDHLHKVSTEIIRSSRRVVVGNVSASRLVKTRMAKSVLDAGWSTLRTLLRYKATGHGVEYQEVDEAYTSRTCSCCGVIPDSSPKGLGALRMREWRCDACGAVHDRDVNAARNILGAARRPPAEEIAA